MNRKWLRRALGSVLCGALCLGLAQSGAAQGAPGPEAPASSTESPAAPPPEPEAPATDEDRARLAELEQELAALTADAKAWSAKAAELKQAGEGAVGTRAQLAAELAELKTRAPDAIPGDADIQKLETELLGAEQDLKLAQQKAAELELEETSRSDRRKKLPALLIAAKQRVMALGDPTPADPMESALARASRQVDEAGRKSLEAEIRAYEAELGTFDARGGLLRQRIDRAAARIAFEASRRRSLQAAVTKRQEAAANAEAERARESVSEVETLPEAVKAYARELAEQNAALADERTGKDGLPSRIDELRAKLARADARVAQLEADYERLTRKVAAVGLSDAVGLLLRKQRSEAPDVGKYRRFIRMRQDLINQVQIELLERRDERRTLTNVDAVLKRAMKELGRAVREEDRPAVEGLLRDLLETKRTYLEALIGDHEVYFQNLVDFDARQQELIEKTEQMLLFIDERVLWIPSGDALRPRILGQSVDAVEWLLSPRYVEQLGRAALATARAAPLVTVAFVFLAGVFWPARRRLIQRIEELGTVARSPTCDHVRYTWAVAGYSLVLSAWLPGLLYVVGWQLSVSENATQYVRSIAHGLTSASVLWLTLEVPRQLLRRDGLAAAHFAAPEDAVLALWKQLRWLTAVAVPTVFMIQVFEARAEDAWRESIGRVGFVALMLAVALFTQSALREPRGSIWKIVKEVPELSLRPWIWVAAQVALVGGAVVLIGAAIRGYYWTALQLAESLHFTLVFIFMLVALFMLFVRWALVARRHVAFERLRKQRAAAGSEKGGESVAEEEAVDLGVADAQTARLLRSAAFVALLMGLWVIWADLLPATGILREVELWNATKTVSVATTNAAGETRYVEQDRVMPITLADLALAGLIAMLTLVVVRNLPGVLEITVLSRLGAGERYAYASISKYGVTVLGIIVAFNAIGIGWSNIQWLVAAVGLGLGFGLQEIFANFVSGLIILFERPIRVGDTVTVGNVSGVVSRVRIRATWITGFDRKELVVPNKEFVTTQLINWSLSDAVLRIEIPVGIAYGSDTEKALEVLYRVARANRKVLEDPKPEALFLGFGESSLDFQLRVFSPDVERRIQIQHELHMAIDREFRKEGIEIAFPQRDLHVRSVVVPASPTGA